MGIDGGQIQKSDEHYYTTRKEIGGASLKECHSEAGREFLEWGCPELSTAVLGEAA